MAAAMSNTDMLLYSIVGLACLLPANVPRTLMLGFRSKFRSNLPVASVRTGAVETLRRSLHRDPTYRIYKVVQGVRGVGKSCFVDTATQGQFGVVKVRVPAGMAWDQIIFAVGKAVTNRHIFLHQDDSLSLVLWLHRKIFGKSVTVVLRAQECAPGSPQADLCSAARGLSERGMEVIIDGAANAVEDPLPSGECSELTVTAMTRDSVESLPQHATLHAALKDANLADVVWAVVGGAPSAYNNLAWKWQAACASHPRAKFGKTTADFQTVVSDFVRCQLGEAIHRRDRAVRKNPAAEAVYARFQSVSVVVYERGIINHKEETVLRVANSSQLVPADAATAVVLSFNLKDVPSIEELKRLLKGGTLPVPYVSSQKYHLC